MTPDRLRQIESVSEQHEKMTIPQAEDWIPYNTDPEGIWEAGMLAGSLGMVPIVRELLDHIHELESRFEPWIPAGEKVPEVYKEVLILLDGTYVTNGYLTSHGRWWCPGIVTKINVTHWKPIPQLPEVVK